MEIVKDKEKSFKCFSYEVNMLVHIIADNEATAKAELDSKGGIVTKRDVKLVNTTTLYGEEKVESGVVAQVIVADGPDWCEQNLGGKWVQTSYNTLGGVHSGGKFAIHKNYAGIGYYYDSIRDAFIVPKPFPMWTLNEESCLWDSPVPYPNDGKRYMWNEDIINWQLINQEQ